MLDLMRKHAGTWLIKVILGAIIIVFTFWGIGSYRMQRGMRVAMVDGTTITVDQYRDAYNRILDQLRQQFGNNLNEDLLKMFNVKKQALDSVINQALLVGEAERLKLRVTDEELADAIRSAPAFQNNGQFDSRLYRRVLNMNRMTPESFEIGQRESLLIGKLRDLIVRGVKVSDTEAKEWYNWSNASVKVAYVLFEPTKYQQIGPGEKEIVAYYEENKNAYKTEPMIRVRYVKFSPADYKERVAISDDRIAEYYAANPDEFEKPKTVEARHILIKSASDDSAEKIEQARLKAMDILKQIREGADFAETAKQYSEGPSRENGGYLGTFDKKTMVAPFAEKAFALKEGEVSEPVRTQFGWHLIKVEKINPEGVISLEEATPNIRDTLVGDQAANMAYDQAGQVYDATFDRNDLSQIAADFKLDLLTSELFDRKGPATGVADPAEFAEAAFKLKDTEIGEIQKIGENYYIMQTVEKAPEKIPDLETVRERVKVDLTKKLQEDKAKADAQTFLDRVKSGKTFEETAASLNVETAETGWFQRSEAIPDIGYEPALAESAFTQSAQKPFPETVLKGNRGYFVTRFVEKKLPEENGFVSEKPAIRQRLQSRKEQQTFIAFLDNLKNKSEIVIYDDYQE